MVTHKIPNMYSHSLTFFSSSSHMSVVESRTWRLWISFAASSSRSAIRSGFPSCTDFLVLMFLRIVARVLSLWTRLWDSFSCRRGRMSST